MSPCGFGFVGAFPVCVLSLFFKVCRFVFVCLFVSGGVLSGLSGGVWLCFVVFRHVYLLKLFL